jgi:SpoVK/Ycf46/Vps4 family AAA+-type ATPase
MGVSSLIFPLAVHHITLQRLLRCFQEHIQLKVPSIEQRCVMFSAALSKIFPSWNTESRHRLATQAAANAHAYTPADIVNVVHKLTVVDAEVRGFFRGNWRESSQFMRLLLQSEHDVARTLLALLARTKPSVLTSSSLAVTTPSLSWDDVIGLHTVKDSLREVVVLPSQHPEVLARPLPIPLPPIQDVQMFS